MNRLSRTVAALALASLALSGVTAQAKKDKQPKHKKNQDLSANPLANVKSKQPDKELFDKAMIAMKKGRFDVARLDLQTMLNTYPDSEFRMRAKLAVGDSWFKEGGTAALTQAEAEYKDFITFFPNAPEAAEAQMKVGDIYYQQMEKPDRDFNNAENAERRPRGAFFSAAGASVAVSAVVSARVSLAPAVLAAGATGSLWAGLATSITGAAAVSTTAVVTRREARFLTAVPAGAWASAAEASAAGAS